MLVFAFEYSDICIDGFVPTFLFEKHDTFGIPFHVNGYLFIVYIFTIRICNIYSN